jgi:hypothetical protein
VSGQFSLFPVAGLIPPGGFQLLALQFCPTAAGSFSESVVCSINGLDSGRSLELGMTGTGDVARLACKASVYFKPTCVGAASARQLALTNASKIPVHFLFSISDKVKVSQLRHRLGHTGNIEHRSGNIGHNSGIIGLSSGNVGHLQGKRYASAHIFCPKGGERISQAYLTHFI